MGFKQNSLRFVGVERAAIFAGHPLNCEGAAKSLNPPPATAEGKVLEGSISLAEWFEVFFQDLVHALAEIHAIPKVAVATDRVVFDSAWLPGGAQDYGITFVEYGRWSH